MILQQQFTNSQKQLTIIVVFSLWIADVSLELVKSFQLSRVIIQSQFSLRPAEWPWLHRRSMKVAFRPYSATKQHKKLSSLLYFLHVQICTRFYTVSLRSAPCWSIKIVPSPNLIGTALNTTLFLSLCHSRVSSFTCSLHLLVHFAWRWLPCRLCGAVESFYSQKEGLHWLYIMSMAPKWPQSSSSRSNQAEIYSWQPVVGSYSNVLGDTSPSASVPSQNGATNLSLIAIGSIFCLLVLLFIFSQWPCALMNRSRTFYTLALLSASGVGAVYCAKKPATAGN